MAISSISSKLIDAATKIVNILKQIEDINKTIKLIAINTTLEASRSPQIYENFSSLSLQVKMLSERSEESFPEIKFLIDRLNICCKQAIAVRLTDLSIDIIDKIDRNLFERNCDCQAWATFEDNITACLTGNGDSANLLLNNLVNVYEVYHDILLLNKEGIVIASGKNSHLIGENQSNRSWFKNVIHKKSLYVTDMYFSESVNNYTISYSTPVLDQDKNLIGVLTTRFNWDFICDIINKVKLESNCKAYLISSSGIIISSKQKYDILRDNMFWLSAGESAIEGNRGYSIESSRNGQWKAYGFSRTKGYNAYAGKGWSVIVDEPIHLENPKVILETLSENKDSKNKTRSTAYSEEVNRRLLDTTHQLSLSIDSINKINNVTTTLALNAAIRAKRAGDKGGVFSVLAEEVKEFSKKSDILTNEINSTLSSLNQVVNETVSTRLADAAFDTIDKVDRNLFERFCDILAWTTFDKLVNCAELNNNNKEANALLKDLHGIYEVYHDIYLLNTEGEICATAINQDLIGSNQSNRKWFQKAIKGEVIVTEMYNSKTVSAYTVSYSAPVKNKNGKIVGVLTTRFNWNFILEILNATQVYSDCQVYLLNSKGIVIASENSKEILKKDFSKYDAFKLASKGKNGFVTERSSESNTIYLIGYSKTEGYIKYKGKEWCVLILQQKSFE